jgi:hypothetical protein
MIVQRLNMDNSWCISLGGMRVLVDPWLEGVEVDFFPWFNTQWHRTMPLAYDKLPDYDIVLITQKYPDHFHSQTLLKLLPKKLIVPASIEKKIKALLPDAIVIPLSKAYPQFQEQGLTVEWYPTSRKIDPIYDAVLLSDAKESVFIAPHGYHFSEPPKLSVPLSVLISTCNHFRLPFFLGGTVAPGIEGLKHLNTALSPNHIIATHDEDKHAKGLVMRVAKVVRIGKQQLSDIPELYQKCLEINDYNPINL